MMTIVNVRLPARRRLVIAMLCAFMAINTADKVAFGVAALPIMHEMDLSSSQFGLLGSAFYLLFSLAAVVAGALGDRIPTTRLIGTMALIWSAAQLPLLAPLGFGAFLLCRVVLGAGEGPALPSALHVAYDWYRDADRPNVTAAIEAGIPIGAALGTFAVARFLAGPGWHAAFGVLGLTSLVWCGLWWLLDRSRGERPAPRDPALVVPVRTLLLTRTIAGVVLAGFAGYLISALALVWFPTFLELATGLARPVVGELIGTAWLVQVVLFAFTGTLSVRLTRRGHSSDVARAALATGGLIAGGIAMLALASTAVPWLTVPLAAMFLGSTTVAVTVLPPIVAEIVPALQRGTALGACIGVASLGAIAGPAVFGHAIDVLGANAPAYRHAFAAAGVVVIAAAAVAHLLMRPREAGERLRMLRDAAAPEWARQGG